MDDEIVRLAKAAANGEYAMIQPLLDRLEETGDDRRDRLFRMVGDTVKASEAAESGAVYALRRIAMLRHEIKGIFWPECAGGMGEALAWLESQARRWDAMTDEERMGGLPEEMAPDQGHAELLARMGAALRLPETLSGQETPS